MQFTVATLGGHPRTMAVGAVFHASVTTWSILADGANSTNTLEVAVIGALALVFAAAVPALVGLLRKENEPKSMIELRRTTARLVAEITADRDEWKHTAEAAVRGTEVRDVEIDRLRGLVVELGGNPFPPHVHAPGVTS